MRTPASLRPDMNVSRVVGMKPLSERDENLFQFPYSTIISKYVGMKPLSERDENQS